MDNQSLLLIQPLEVSDVLNVGVSSRLVYEGSPCDAFPCWNGGTCVELRRKKDPPIKKRTVNRSNHSKGYFCKCGPFFTGQHCQQRRLQVQSPIDEEKNCVHRNCDDSGTGCLPQQLGSQCLPPVEQKAARTLAMDFDKQISEGDQQQHQQQCPPTAQQCLNGGLCIRLGTAPGHLECICPAQFAGSHCQFSSATTAPLLLPGLLLLSLLLFLLSLILLLFHNSTAGGFFFLHLPRRTRGAGKSGIRRRNCPPLLQWSNNQQLELEEEERGLTGHDFGGFNDEAEPGANMELRERPAGTTGGGIGFCAPSRGPAGPFSLRSAVVQFQSDTAKQEKAGGGGFEPSKVVHI